MPGLGRVPKRDGVVVAGPGQLHCPAAGAGTLTYEGPGPFGRSLVTVRDVPSGCARMWSGPYPPLAIQRILLWVSPPHRFGRVRRAGARRIHQVPHRPRMVVGRVRCRARDGPSAVGEERGRYESRAQRRNRRAVFTRGKAMLSAGTRGWPRIPGARLPPSTGDALTVPWWWDAQLRYRSAHGPRQRRGHLPGGQGP